MWLCRQDLLAKLARLQAQVAGTEAEADASADTCKALQQQLLGTATSSDSNVHSR